MKRWITWTTAAAAVALAIAAAATPPVQVSGTFAKGPAIGGMPKPAGATLHITGEQAVGSAQGGPLTGSAAYSIGEESINFAGTNGTVHMIVTITRADGAQIVVGLDGVTSGATPTAAFVSVSGSFRVLTAMGAAAGLHGEGTFAANENFQTGEATGTFSGQFH